VHGILGYKFISEKPEGNVFLFFETKYLSSYHSAK